MTAPSRPSHAGLRHVALNVLDLPAMQQFYVDLLGFNIEWHPDPDNLYLCSGIDNLALHRVDDRGSDKQSLDHIGLIVDEPDSVDAWYDFLSHHRVQMASQPKTHRDGARSFYCYDPERNVIQIIFHPPISGTRSGAN